MQHKVIIILILLLSLNSKKAHSQQASTTTGGDIFDTGGSVSYSIGQIDYTTNVGANGTISQGVQQPYEISVITAINASDKIELNANIYPNPTIDIILLTINKNKLENCSYQLFDNCGKILESKKISICTIEITMQQYASAIYYLKIINNKEEIKTFKIIKN